MTRPKSTLYEVGVRREDGGVDYHPIRALDFQGASLIIAKRTQRTPLSVQKFNPGQTRPIDGFGKVVR